MVAFIGQIHTNDPEKVIAKLKAAGTDPFYLQKFEVHPGYVGFVVDVDRGEIGYDQVQKKVYRRLKHVLSGLREYTLAFRVQRDNNSKRTKPIPPPATPERPKKEKKVPEAVPPAGKLHSDVQKAPKDGPRTQKPTDGPPDKPAQA